MFVAALPRLWDFLFRLVALALDHPVAFAESALVEMSSAHDRPVIFLQTVQ